MRKLLASLFIGVGIVAFAGCGSSNPGAHDPTHEGKGTSSAERIEHKGARVAITVPKGWKTKQDGEVLTVMDQNEDVAAAFTVVEESALGQASQNVGKSLGEKIQNLKFGKEEKIDINGMKGIAIDGDGQMSGVDVDLMVVVLDTPVEGKAMMILAIAEDAKLARHKDELKFLFSNITPL